MTKQEVFDFHQPERLDWNDFVESDENRDVISYLKQWNSWKTNGLIICGASGVGKTHILTLWQQSAKATKIQMDDLNHNPRELFENQHNFAIDDIEFFLQPQNYNWFFDFFNILKEKQGVIVATSSTSPSIWDISLQDLKSRLLLIPVLKISTPGDNLLFHIIKKLAKDLGTEIADNCVQYILNNFPRDIQEIRNLINVLNKFSLEKKQAISLQFIKKHVQKSTI